MDQGSKGLHVREDARSTGPFECLRTLQKSHSGARPRLSARAWLLHAYEEQFLSRQEQPFSSTHASRRGKGDRGCPTAIASRPIDRARIGSKTVSTQNDEHEEVGCTLL